MPPAYDLGRLDPIPPTPLMTTAKLSGMSAALTAQPSLPLFGRTAESQTSAILPGDSCRLCHRHQQPGPSGGKHLQLHVGWSHGFIWQDGVMTDLNTLIPADSNLFIIAASNINERGQISGMATVLTGPHTGKIHAYSFDPRRRMHRRVDCRFRTYTPAFHFARECLQPLFAEIRTRPIRAIKGILGASAPCIPAMCCAKAPGRRLCGTFWVTPNVDVTQNVYRKGWWEELGSKRFVLLISTDKRASVARTGEDLAFSSGRRVSSP